MNDAYTPIFGTKIFPQGPVNGEVPFPDGNSISRDDPIPSSQKQDSNRDTLLPSCIEVETIKDIVLLKCLQNPFRISLIFESVFEKEHIFWILYPPLKEGKLFTLLFCKGTSQSKPFLGYDTVKDEIRFCDGVENSTDIFFPVLQCMQDFKDELVELCPKTGCSKHIPLWEGQKGAAFVRAAYFTSIMGKERTSCTVFRWGNMLAHVYLVNSTYGEWVPLMFTAPDHFEGRNLIGYTCEPTEEFKPVNSREDKYNYHINILNIKKSKNTIFDSFR